MPTLVLMYVPVYNTLDDEREIRALVAAMGAAELITVKPDGYPTSTLLPVIWDSDRLIFHMAKANPHWRLIRPASAALAVVTGPQAYVSAAWYPSKQEHGRVVPTWNYSAVHFTGSVTVHRDSAWLRNAVSRLTQQNEERRPDPWHVTDAPGTYVDKQLRAIVGVELMIERVEGKAKLSQNRSTTDHSGVIDGLRREDDGRESAVAAAMERTGTRS
jgi:transcriptional regulator